jgi:signal-transduction protein with cAMP-binding, CBS, and nucleotidyltransferase domain
MQEKLEEVLRRSTLFRRLSTEDRQRLAAVASVKQFDKGAALFNEGDGSDLLYTVHTGRVKVFKMTARGTDVILELFGPGDPVGAVAVYESRPYPAMESAATATSSIPPMCGNDQTVKLPTLTGPTSGGVKTRTARIGALRSRSWPT